MAALARKSRMLAGAGMLAAMLASCGPPSHYLGIPLGGMVTPDEQATLAEGLRQGDTSASPCRWRAPGDGQARAVPCANVPLAALARAAHGKNKHAQLELGIRFEQGRGVGQDWARALELYRMAGADSRSGEPVRAPNYAGTLLSDPQIGAVDTTQPSMARADYPGRPAAKGLPEARARYRALKQKIARDDEFNPPHGDTSARSHGPAPAAPPASREMPGSSPQTAGQRSPQPMPA
jgi:hypothetical protein